MYNQKHKAWAKQVSKKVAQIDIETKKVLAIYPSIYAATLAIGKDKNFAGMISNACHGKAKKALGYIWKFVK
jgi:hypothetical protein